jgi:cyclophilin family peptidyl-prolyl cis-trans isomerase
VSKAAKRERQKENRERARVERERLQRRDRQMRTLRSFAFFIVPVIGILAIITLVSGKDDAKAETVDPNKSYTATIETSQGNMEVALDAKKAPKATGLFLKLADEHYYDGLCIDRLARDFVIQGGSKACAGGPGSSSSVVGELPTDHYPVGSLAAAKTDSDPPGKFDGVFFLVTGAGGATLPNDYARFGSIVQGLDVAQRIDQLPIKNGASDGPPANKIAITRVRVKVADKPTSSTTAATPSTTAPAATSSTTG